MNIGIFTGRLSKDAEVRQSKTGTAMCNLNISVDTGWGDNKKTLWIRGVIFGRKAESGLVQYLVKGQEVGIRGELSMNEWTNAEGQVKSSLECVIENIELIGGKRSGGQSAPSMGEDVPF